MCTCAAGAFSKSYTEVCWQSRPIVSPVFIQGFPLKSELKVSQFQLLCLALDPSLQA